MTASAAGSERAGIGFGILCVVAAGAMLAAMDAIGKFLSGRIDVLQVIWGRYAMHTLIVLLALLLTRRNLGFLRSARPLAQTTRCLVLLGVTVLMYTALTVVPLADATAVLFFAPVLTTLLSGLFLGEAVGARRGGAVVVGFLGVLLIVRPGLATDPYMLLPVLAACCLALYWVLTRHLNGKDDPHATLFYATAVGAAVLSGVVPFRWTPLDGLQWTLLLVMGALGAVAHYLVVVGFRYAPASTLSPFMYSQLLAASLISLALFGDPLKLPTALGGVLVVGSGLFIWLRERGEELQ